MKRIILYYFVFGFLMMAYATHYKSVNIIDFMPECTSLISPQDGSSSVPLSADLVWNEVTGATGYILTVGTSPGGSEIINAVDVGNVLSFNPSTNLPGSASASDPTFIYVSITPYNDSGNAQNCIEESFTTSLEECPSVPPIPGLSLGRFMCSGGMTITDPLFVGLQDEEWEIIEPNPNVSGQTQPSVGDLFIDDVLVNNTNVIQSVLYRRTYTPNCPFLGGSQSFIFFVRPDNATDQSQVFEIADDIESGSNTDGISTFDLQSFNSNLENIIHTSPSLASPSVFYYESEEDAINEVSPLEDFYQNSTPFSQTIYAIVAYENSINTNDEDCILPIPITLTVTHMPTIENPPIDLEVCEESGSDTFGVFDLTINTPIVIGTQDPAFLMVTYYESQIDANNGTNPIPTPNLYINSIVTPLTIFVRIESVLNGTFQIGVFNIIVNPIPTVLAELGSIELCSENGAFAIFDLTIFDAVATGGDLNLIVTHFASLDDLNANIPIPNPTTYANVSNPQLTYVKVTDLTTSCSAISTITLVINTTPIPVQPAIFELCDDIESGSNSDGLAIFDLHTRDDEITGSDPTLTVSYHLTQSDADEGTATLPDMYQNVTPDFQTIWVRVEDNMTGCYELITLTIAVIPLPSPVTSLDYEVCDIDNDGFADFLLSEINDEIINGEPNLSIFYFETEEIANDGDPVFEIDPAIPYTNIILFQTIYARVVSSDTGCFTIVPVNLVVLDTPIINSPAPLTACDQEMDGIEVFDLASQEAQILNGIDPTTFSIDWFISIDDAEAGFPIIADPFNYVSTTATVYASVTDISQSTTTFCKTITSLDLIVEENCIDSDDDGVTDTEEDLNGNGNLDDDDTDGDTIPNYLDDDDDGDSVMTIDEITGIGAGLTTFDFIDTDDDMIENYLDDDDDGDTILTVNEDYNSSGSPLDDDTNNNNIPDFLDADVALNIESFASLQVSIYPNPVESQLTINSDLPFSKITIYNSLGQKVYLLEKEVSTMQRMDISNLSKGLYFIKMNESEQVFKFIKK